MQVQRALRRSKLALVNIISDFCGVLEDSNSGPAD